MDEIYLYHLTLYRPDTVTSGVVINTESLESFKFEEVFAVARGQWLELLAISDSQFQVLHRQNTFRSVTKLNKITIDGLECLVVLFEDGIEVYNVSTDGLTSMLTAELKDMHELNIDPKGRLLVCNSIDGSTTAFPVFSGELGDPVSTTSDAVIYTASALGRGYNNPAFFFIERSKNSDQKFLGFYEFNLGINHMVKLWSKSVPNSAQLIVPVPKFGENKTGCVCFTDHSILWVDFAGNDMFQMDTKCSVVCAALIEISAEQHIILGQFSDKSWFEIEFINKELVLTALNFQVPGFVAEIHPLKSGHIYLCLETGGVVLAQVTDYTPFNLQISVSESGLAPLTTANLQRNGNFLIGKAQDPAITDFKFGLSFDTMAETPLPDPPLNIFTTKCELGSANDGFIVISFKDSTTLLSIDEEGSVEETSEAETGLFTSMGTLGVHYVGNGIVQVHNTGFRYTQNKRPIAWSTPNKTPIIHCAFTPTQVALGLTNGKIVYFEFANGELVESQQKLHPSSKFTSFCFSERLIHEIKSTHIYVACEDSTIKRYKTENLARDQLTAVSGTVSSVIQSKNQLIIGYESGDLSVLLNDQFRTWSVGSNPVVLKQLKDPDMVSVISGKTSWLLSPNLDLIYTPNELNCVYPFTTEDIPNGAVGIDPQGSLLVMSLEMPINRCLTTQTTTKISSTPLNIIRTSKGGYYSVNSEGIDYIESQNVVKSCSQKLSSGIMVKFSNSEHIVACSGSDIYTYTLDLELVHTTTLSAPVTALLAFKSQLLIAMAHEILLLDLGKKQLLKKAYLDVPQVSHITTLKSQNDFVYIGDSRYSLTVLEFINSEFIVLKSDFVPRSVKHILPFAQNLCIADLYGQITVLNRELKPLCSFYVPDAITSLSYGRLNPQSKLLSIFYTGISGTIGMLTPFTTLNEAIECKTQELEIKDTTKFRSKFSPQRNVVDGDICESHNQLAASMRFLSGLMGMY